LTTKLNIINENTAAMSLCNNLSTLPRALTFHRHAVGYYYFFVENLSTNMPYTEEFSKLQVREVRHIEQCNYCRV